MHSNNSMLPFARSNRRFNNALNRDVLRNGGVIRYESVIARQGDTDEVPDDDTLSYQELRDDLHTVGWINHEMTMVVTVDMNGEDMEFRGEYAHFCSLSIRQQAAYIASVRAHISALIGVSSTNWEASEAFILDAIQDETPDDVLKEMAYASYFARLDWYGSAFSNAKPELPESDDHIRISQQGSSGKSDQPEDFDINHGPSHGKCWSVLNDIHPSRKKSREFVAWSRNATKGARNSRETIRLNSEFYFDDDADTFDILSAISEFDSSEREFVTVKAQLRMCLDDSLTNEQLDWLDDINHGGYDYEPKAFNFRFRRSSYDFFDDFGDDCTCLACIGDWGSYRENDDFQDAQDLVERFGDRDDERADIFVGFGESDSDIDRTLPSFSSSVRFSYRFRGLSLRKQEALQR